MADSPTRPGMPEEVLDLVRSVETALDGTDLVDRVTQIRERLEGPLRVAIAGRVKAGKSTLLNALVGERLAATDAGECTRIVTWYSRGPGYRVAAALHSGERKPLPSRRTDGALSVELGSLTEREVLRLEVEVPTSALERITLIDTPGLASLDDENSRRTRDFLDADADRPPDADAVIYLMRHLHRSDTEFLDAFMDRSVTAASPINAVAVLSRADEIGAGRLDALESASRIAERYTRDEQLRGLCATVVPVAGLLAETALTLREDEAATLRTLAATPEEELTRMLLAVDHFCDLHASDLTVELRRDLLDRLGMFGVRLALQLVRSGLTTAAQLAPQLLEASGLRHLRRTMEEHFLPRARVLQARTALIALRAVARDLQRLDPGEAARIDHAAERIEASATEFARLRAAHLVAGGLAGVTDGDRADLERLLLSARPAAALGVATDDPQVLRTAALEAIERWRTRRADPTAEPRLIEVYDTAVRTCEEIFAAAVGSSPVDAR